VTTSISAFRRRPRSFSAFQFRLDGETGLPDIMHSMCGDAASKTTSLVWNPSELVMYFVLAYGFSLILWLAVLLGRHPSQYVFVAGTFGPTLAALTTHRIFAGDWKAVRLGTTFPDLLRGIASGLSTASGVTQKRPMRVTSKPANGNEARGR
jgi:hypothetical protein